MKNFARIIAPVALFALASLAAVACSDPEIEHYTNPDSDVYLDRLLGIEGAAENADSILFAMAKDAGCYSKRDTTMPNDSAGAVECMREWLAAHEDSLLAANAPSSEGGSSAKPSSASGSSDEGESSEGDASSSSEELQGYDCEQILEWERGVPASMYDEGLCYHDIEGESIVFECLEETMCKSVTPGTNVSVWREKGPCR